MLNLSRHCERRLAQRGITERLLGLVLANADIDRSVGGNCRLLQVSHEQSNQANLHDSLGRIAVIWSDSENRAVTAFQLWRSRAGKRYRRR